MQNTDITSKSSMYRLMSLVWQYRKVLLVTLTFVFIISTIIAFLLPKWYRGSITFIVNEQGKGKLISELASAVPFNLMQMESNRVDLYVNLIKSRRVLDSLDSLYHLQQYYDIKDRQQFYKELNSDIDVRDNNDNTITLNFYYKEDAKKAAEIANKIFVELSDLSLELNSERNRSLRMYLQNSYDVTISRLRESEKKLTNFQANNQIYDVEAQLKMIIDKITELEIEKIQNEIQMLVLKSTLAQNNQEVKALETKISIMQQKINEIKYTSNKNNISLSQMPEKAIEYMNLFRDVKVLNKLLEFLIPQLENARLEEIKTSSDLQIIDNAIAEDYKAKPKRISIIFTICFLYFIVFLLVVSMYNYYLRNKNIFSQIKEQDA